ncbi:MAG: nucleotidyltransferase family protein [Bacteroidaceae bacterium]|nr:nucleotidyltransferase family protein [Bacteroidaceae bacterium]
MKNAVKTLLSLLRKFLCPDSAIEVSADADWEETLELAISQGVLGVCFEAVEKLPTHLRPHLEMLMTWYGHTEHQCSTYEHSWAVASKLDRLWAAKGIRATVLKGRAIAQYYPVPGHRYSCDLDVFIERDWERACKLLEEKGVRLEREVYKEVEFTLDDVYVECHRFITPLRGNRHLQKVERYLRSLLDDGHIVCFEGTNLICPPLMFNAMLFVEHALGDFQQGKLLLKHVVDWAILRRQDIDWRNFRAKCEEFRFDRFLGLMDALADVVEGKRSDVALSPSYREVFDEILQMNNSPKPNSWFLRRVNVFFDIIRNGKKFSRFGYTSMPSFLFHALWGHFFGELGYEPY